MICVESLYLSLNRILLLAVGLWPYRQSKFVRFQLILLHAILVSCIIFQFTTFVTSKCFSQFAIEVLAAASFFILFVINYSTFSFNLDVVTRLLEMLQRIYDELRDEKEVAILQKYGCIAKSYTGVLTLFATCGMSVIVFSQLWPCILDIVLPVNESRPHSLLHLRMEYFIDQEKYFYFIVLHSTIAICVGGIVILATGTMIIVYFQYTCGMFKVASYRMERAISIDTLQASTKEKDLISKEIISAIDIHRNAIEFIELLMSKLGMFYLFVAGTLVVSLSLNLYQIFQELASGFNAERMILPLLCISSQYLYIYLANNCAQQVTDHYNKLFTTVYDVQWYAAPLRIQKIMLFLLQRGTKAFNLTIGGFFVGSLENAASMTSISISYFTVLYSAQLR